MKRFEKQLTVGPEDLDELQHVNNVRYLEWVQQISKEHWQELSNPEWDARYFWVVRSHHMEYFRPALAGDRLLLTTYVPEVTGPLSLRVVEISQAGKDVLIARCQTQWCLVDDTSKRPCRIPEAIRACFYL